MKVFSADLHIHTCLSSCADLDMTPRKIVDRALRIGLDMIAISDHNSAENLKTAVDIAAGEGLELLPAMEITSVEEAHVLALFGGVDDALVMQETVYRNLPDVPIGQRDYQVVVNEHDEVMGFNRRCLFCATALSMGDLVREIHDAGGLAIACHVDREAFSLSSQFGFVPEGMGFDAFEVVNPKAAAPLLEGFKGVPILCFSDAHNLDDIGRRSTEFTMHGKSFEELSMALKGADGRRAGCA